MFCLKSPCQPLDLINEANLMACRLAPMGDGGETSEAQLPTTTMVVVLANQPAPRGIIEVPAMFDLPWSSAPPTERTSALDGLEPTHPTKVIADPVCKTEVPAPARTVPMASNIRPRTHILIRLKSCVSSCVPLF